MEDIAHIKLIRGVVIVRAVDLERVLNFLSEYGAEIYTQDSILTSEGRKVLTKEVMLLEAAIR